MTVSVGCQPNTGICSTSRATAEGQSAAAHVHNIACGTPTELELPMPLYDLSVAATLIPCTKERLHRFLLDRRYRDQYPGRYRLEQSPNAYHRRRIRVLYAREIIAARRHLLRGRDGWRRLLA